MLTFPAPLPCCGRKKGISQRKAAKELGISQALLSHYENGIREPGLAFVKRRAITTTSRRTICSGARSIATAA